MNVEQPRSGGISLFTLVVLSVVVGFVLGIGTALPGFDLLASNEQIARPIDSIMNDPVAPQLPPENGPQPKLVVDDAIYDFGALENLSEDSHTFVVRNEGDYPLELVLRKTSCKCTVGKLGGQEVDPESNTRPRITVPPGGQTDVTLNWTVKRDYSDQFRQTALLLTNDPETPRLQLEITGKIAQTVRTTPSAFSVGKLLTMDSSTKAILIESTRDEPLEISEARPTIEDTAEFFDLELEPLAPEDLQIEGAKSGYRVRLTVKPGLRQGAIQQTIALATNLKNMPTIEIPVYGMVDSDFAIIGGRGWDSATRKVAIGRVPRETGTTRKLTIYVRGPLRDEVELKPPVVTPEDVIVTLGEPKGKGEAKSVQYPLTIEIPKGAPVMNRLGNDQGDLGLITIETTHPDVAKLEIHLQFATE